MINSQSNEERVFALIEQLFHATHVKHAHYCCPVTGQKWSLQDCLEHVQLQQHYFERNAGARVAIGITPWKRKYLAQFLRSPDGSLRFSDTDDVCEGEIAVRWSFSDVSENKTNLLADKPLLDTNADKCIRVEDGFIRSRGLGSDFAAPASLVFDQFGLYFDARTSSFLENLLENYQCNESELKRAGALRKRLLAANLTKYNVGELADTSSRAGYAKLDRKRILVIGQVEGDQSLLRGTSDVTSNAELLEAVRANYPDAQVVYKPHPDVVSGNRRGEVDPEVISRCADTVETSRHLLDCLKECDELHTMTSLSGFEALMRGKRVVTYGLPFYAGWGLTHDSMTCARRSTKRGIDELVYMCLVLYPHYVDLDSGEFMSIEQLVEKLNSDNTFKRKINGVRWARKLSNIIASLAYRQ